MSDLRHSRNMPRFAPTTNPRIFMNKRSLLHSAIALLLGTALAAPTLAQDKKTIKVGVTAGPHAQIMDQVRRVAAKDGLAIQVIEFSDCVQPNAALVAGTATFGPMSRDAKGSEISSFESKFGYKPLLLPTSIDMLAVYVHRNNPIESLTFAQIDSVFSSTRKQGSKEQSKIWGQLGATGDAANKPESSVPASRYPAEPGAVGGVQWGPGARAPGAEEVPCVVSSRSCWPRWRWGSWRRGRAWRGP